MQSLEDMAREYWQQKVAFAQVHMDAIAAELVRLADKPEGLTKLWRERLAEAEESWRRARNLAVEQLKQIGH